MFQGFIERLKQMMRGNDERSEESTEQNEQHRIEALQEERAEHNYIKKPAFRFPVIKDEEDKKYIQINEDERFLQELKKERQQKRNHNDVQTTNHQQEMQQDKSNKWFSNDQFRPTEIPSPVYGFTIQAEEKVVPKESQIIQQEDFEEQITEDKVELEQRNDEELIMPIEEKRESILPKRAEAEELIELTESTEQVEEEDIQKVQAEQSEQVKQVEAAETVKEKEKSTVPIKEKRQEKPETKQLNQTIPFNVLMLPADKKRVNIEKQQPLSRINEEDRQEQEYVYPSIQLLDYPSVNDEKDDTLWLEEQAETLEQSLQNFNVEAKVVHVTKGPSVTRFEIQPGKGVKVNKITGLIDDIKLALAAKDIRIEAPIPGKNTIGIEVPNRQATPVFLREILRRDVFTKAKSPLTVALGLDISGQPIVTDLNKMPHGLVAGATGSGKSVCINSILLSLLYKSTPDEVKLLLIDPKMVELAPYNGIPHLISPVITDAKQATAALKWIVLEMERRYELFSQTGVRDLARYNEIYSEGDKQALPYIIVIIDELADLMMVSPQDVEESIARIAQKARACGIHLLLATQRPSVDVITGLIKANIPTRIAFSVSSQTDSRTILDIGGAERLLGRGDMLFHENGMAKPIRVQGTFVSDEEIENVIAHVKKQREPHYLLEAEQLNRVAIEEDIDDEYFEEACYFIVEQGSASASSLQRRFRVGYNRAARMIDLMEERGIVSQAMGSKPRHVLVDEIGLEQCLYGKSE